MYNEDKTKWYIKDDYVDVFKNERGNYIIGGSNRKHYIDETKCTRYYGTFMGRKT